MKKYCRVEGCEGEVRARGYCGTHYNQLLKYGRVKKLNVIREQIGENGEIWKDVVDFEGLYQVSNFGRVHSIKTNCILMHCNNKLGYARLILRKNKKNYGCQVHRLVAIAFIPNINNYPEVNHKDENPRNNKLENLEWCTKKYNNNYGTKIQRQVANTDYSSIGEKQSKKVKQISLDGNAIKTWSSANECKRQLGLDNSWIAHCCRGNQKTAYGFRWEYA